MFFQDTVTFLPFLTTLTLVTFFNVVIDFTVDFVLLTSSYAGTTLMLYVTPSLRFLSVAVVPVTFL